MKKLALTAIALMAISTWLPDELSMAAVPEQTNESSVTGKHDESENSFIQVINDWINTIAEEQKLIPWQNADWESQPLGPGTYGWIIHVLHNDAEVGYLVICALPDNSGYRLVEYGQGQYPLFGQTALSRSLLQNGLINSENDMNQLQTHAGLQIERLYFAPFHSLWKISTENNKHFYFDAVTGEQYPLSEQPDKAMISTEADVSATRLAKINKRILLPGFDPYANLSWVVSEPLKIDTFSSLAERIENRERMMLSVRLYNETVMLPFAVIGYTVWDGTEPFVAVEQEDGQRYIPFSSVMKFGQLYHAE